jgi:CRISPR-associated protein Cmr2
LYFFPTFFNELGLEVINPHDRKTGVGARGPILMECVPQGTKGDLFLLYVPFGAIEQGENERRAEVVEDLQVLAQGIQAMLTTYGFGAKTSSGFGVAANHLAGEGKLALRAELAGKVVPSAAPPEPQQPDLPRYLESPTRLHADLRSEDGGLKSEVEYQALIESRGQKYAKKDKQLYDKAQSWWEREGKELAQSSQEPEPEPEPAQPETPPVSEFTFRSLSELCDLAQEVAERLRKRGEA